MADVESAETVVNRIAESLSTDDAMRALAADRAAIREAAKLEVLHYLRARIASHRKGVSMLDARDLAIDDVLRKYQSADSQPAQDGERR